MVELKERLKIANATVLISLTRLPGLSKVIYQSWYLARCTKDADILRLIYEVRTRANMCVCYMAISRSGRSGYIPKGFDGYILTLGFRVMLRNTVVLQTCRYKRFFTN
jgi:hypothetical protein